MLFQEGLGDNTALYYRDEIEVKIIVFISVSFAERHYDGITNQSTNVKPSVIRPRAPFGARMSGAWPDIFFFCLIEHLAHLV